MSDLCNHVVLNLDRGIKCSEPADHSGAHIYRSAWLADGRHDDETRGDDL